MMSIEPFADFGYVANAPRAICASKSSEPCSHFVMLTFWSWQVYSRVAECRSEPIVESTVTTRASKRWNGSVTHSTRRRVPRSELSSRPRSRCAIRPLTESIRQRRQAAPSSSGSAAHHDHRRSIRSLDWSAKSVRTRRTSLRCSSWTACGPDASTFASDQVASTYLTSDSANRCCSERTVSRCTTRCYSTRSSQKRLSCPCR